jgi:hypothetical protein
MSADTRKTKRALRKQYRREHKDAFNKLLEAVKAFATIDLKENLPYKDRFKQAWPAIKPTLEFVIRLRFTGEKFDAPAMQLVILGDKLYGGPVTEEEAVEFLGKLQDIWDFIEKILETLKIVVGDQADAVIDKIIEIGEWLFE